MKARADRSGGLFSRATKLGKNFGKRVWLHLHYAGEGLVDNNDD